MTRDRERDLREDQIELKFLEGVRRRIGDEPDLLKAIGDLYTAVGRHEEGLDVDLLLTRMCSDDAFVWYNLACSLALLDRTGEALDALARAIDLGYDDGDWMRTDTDLQSIRGDERFQALLKKLAT